MFDKKSIPLLAVKDLSLSFAVAKKSVPNKVLRGLSFELQRGSRLGVVGESGSGKSMLAMSILGLAKDLGASLDSGEICFNGENLLAMDEKRLCTIRGKDISLIMQDPFNALHPAVPIGKQLAEVLHLHYPSLSKAERTERIENMLCKLQFKHIPSVLHCYPFELSGGMCQRLLIASAMLTEPQIIIADEPTTALDVTTQAETLHLFRSVLETRHSQSQLDSKSATLGSLIFISHDLNVVSEICGQILVLYYGQLMESCSTETFFTQALSPYSQGLLKARPQFFNGRFPVIGTGAPHNNALSAQGCTFYGRCEQALPQCSQSPPPLVHLNNSHSLSCWHHTG